MGLEDPGFNERPWSQEGNTAKKEAITVSKKMLASQVAVLDTVPQGLNIPCSKKKQKTKDWNEWVCSSLDRTLA